MSTREQLDAREQIDLRLGELLVAHGLLPAEQLAGALGRREGRDLARVLLDEGLVPRYAIDTILKLGGVGLQPLAPADDWRMVTTRGAGGPGSRSASAPSAPSSEGGWPSEAFATGSARIALPPRGRLGKFELLEELGQGGGGWVIRARDPDGREVALKVLRRASEVAIQRFLREAEAVARLRHPNIVALLEQGESDGRHWLAFELVRGKSLLACLDDPKWTRERSAAVLAGAARALHYAHEQSVLHRDVKPTNVLVDGEDRAHLLDFGLARLEDQATPLTSTGAVLGTVRYMAPEQAFPGSAPLDARTDVWGLGATLYHALTRRPPFPRGPLPGERLAPPRSLDPTVPEGLERICLACLVEEQSRRYPTALAVAEDLERFLKGDRVRVRRPGRSRFVQAAVAAAGLAALALAGSRTPATPSSEPAPVTTSPARAREEVAAAEKLLRAAADSRDEAELEAAAEALARAAGASRPVKHLLGERLKELTAALEESTRDLLALAEEPDPVEMARGERPLRGLPALLRPRPQGQPPGAAELELLLAAQERMDARLARGPSGAPLRGHAAGGRATSFAASVALRQAERLGPSGDRLLRGVLLALSQVADAELVPVLARYLAAEGVEERAIPCGRALARIGSEPALKALLEALRRFGPQSRFGAQALRGVGGASQVQVEASSWADLTARGDLSLLSGDALGANRDYQRAVALAPDQGLVWNRLGVTWVRLGRKEQARFCYDVALACEPGSLEARVNRARLLRELGEREAAEADLRAVLARGGGRAAAAWVELANVKLDAGDPAEARRCCDRALALDAQDVAAWNARGNAHVRLGHSDRAELDFSRAIELDPTSPVPWRNRAGARSDRGDHSGARADATRSIELAPKDPDGWIARGDFRRVAGDLDGALGDYKQAVAVDPKSAIAWDALAIGHRMLGQHQVALEHHDRAVDLEPLRASSWLNRAGTLQELDLLERARQDLDRAIELDPKDRVQWSNRASLRRLQKDLEGAEADATRSLQLAPDYLPGLLNRAVIRIDRKDLAGARTDLDRALAIAPESAAAWQHHGIACFRAGELEKAERELTRAIELDRLSSQSWINRGAIRHRLGRSAEGVLDLDQGLLLDPRHADGWANRGLAKKGAGDPAGGLLDLDRAVALEPESANHRKNRSIVHEALGDLQSAEADLTEALRLDPTSAETWQGRAMLRMARGDLDGAEADVAKLLEVDPKRTAVARVLRNQIAAKRQPPP